MKGDTLGEPVVWFILGDAASWSHPGKKHSELILLPFLWSLTVLHVGSTQLEPTSQRALYNQYRADPQDTGQFAKDFQLYVFFGEMSV